MRPPDVLIILAILTDWKKFRVWNESQAESSNEKGFSKTNSETHFGYYAHSTKIPVSNKEMAYNLQLSESEISESLGRSEYSGLISDIKMKNVIKLAFWDFLCYGLKYVFPAKPSGVSRGFATVHSAPPLN